MVAAGAAMWLLYQSMMPADQVGSQEAIIFEVPEGVSGQEVAERLEKEGLIRSGLAFRLLLRYRQEDGALRTGFYRVDPGRPAVKIFEQLVKGATLTRKATIPEGLTLSQTAVKLEEQNVAPAEAVFAIAKSQGQEFGEIFPANLEGYLFPNTYEFPWEADGREAVATMTSLFKGEVLPLWEEHEGKTGLTLQETVILASLVEREAQVANERALIAGVYTNRLAKQMPLQCDATVQYALGKSRAILTYKDLEIRSPYNTYLHPGLPPGPIASPGRASLEAAMNPKPSDFLFYVRNDVKGDGSHVFGRTYREHQRNIAKFQR